MSTTAIKSAVKVLERYEEAIDAMHMALEVIYERGYTRDTTPPSLKERLISEADTVNAAGGEFVRLIRLVGSYE